MTMISRHCVSKLISTLCRKEGGHLNVFVLSHRRCLSALAKVEETQQKPWQLIASVIIERPRIISCPPTELEASFQTMLNDFENEKSLKSDHELRVEEDIRVQEMKRKGLEVLNEPLQFGLDYEEGREKILAKFQRTNLVNIDRAKDVSDLRSINRLPDEKLYLFVSAFQDGTWILPSKAVDGHLSLRQAVDEAVQRTVDAESEAVKVVGNAPFGFHKYIYPTKSEVSQQWKGAKCFLFKAFITEPRENKLKVRDDHIWITKSEMSKHVDKTYRKTIERCLFDY